MSYKEKWNTENWRKICRHSEELAYECDSPDASWVGDFAEDIDMEHSKRDTGDTSAATSVQQRQGYEKDPLLHSYK
jgi:hypothetical protein